MRFSFGISNVLGAVYHRGTVKFGPDGATVYSPVGNKLVVYDLKTNRSSALPTQLNYNIEHIAIHPSSAFLLLASEKSHLYIVSLISGKQLHMKEYKAFSKINHLSFSPDSSLYCVCGGNLALIYFTSGTFVKNKGREITPFKLLRKIKVHHDAITSVSWSKDSRYICFASEDMTLTIYDLFDQTKPLIHLRGHNQTIVSCYFANSSTQNESLYSIGENCQVISWSQADIVSEKEGGDPEPPTKKVERKPRYHVVSKQYLKPEKQSDCYITASDYNSENNLLVLGYNTGHYALFEMPSATMIYELQQDFGSISTICINPTGDWIVLGSSIDHEVDIEKGNNRSETKLLVWEWQSKSHILDRVGSGVTMYNLHECACYSLDGNSVISGNLAGRLKLWDCLSGDTLAEFGNEHSGPIKAVKFAPNKSNKVVISASLDGTIRAYDLQKLKNFRTFKSPVEERSPEFICMDIDSSGEFIAAGTYNYFEVYLYSLKTGKFLEYLAGHEGVVSGVAFSPNSNSLVSSSWDKTVRIWNLFEQAKGARDVVILDQEVITVAFRPDGNQFAASLSNGCIALFNAHTSDQIGAPIEGAYDLGTTQLETDVSRDTKKYFISMNYSTDGNHLIAAGKSNFICIYNVNEKILVKKISVTFNRSMDGLFDYVSKRRRAEFGFNRELLDSRIDKAKPIQLPGVKTSDYGERKAKAVMSTYQVAFCPTMRSFVAATTEGVLTFSLDVHRQFDPYKLSLNVDPNSVRMELRKKNFGLALTQAIQLNDDKLFLQVFESIPLDQIEPIAVSLTVEYADRLLQLVAKHFHKTIHLEYYLTWIQTILYKQGTKLTYQNLSTRNLQQIIGSVYNDLKKNCDYSRYSLDYVSSLTTNK